MASLMDTIKTEMQPAQQKPQLGETTQVERLMRAKGGKAASPTTGPRQSALGERIAARQTELGQEQIGQQSQITQAQQAEQSADITQREQQQAKQFDEARTKQQSDFRRQSDGLLDQYTRGEKTLSTQQDLANMEQIAFGLRMGNQQYIDNLKLEGQKSRLDDRVEFKTQLAQEVFRDMEELMMNDYAFQTIMAEDDREFEKELSAINAIDALNMVQQDIQNQKVANRWTAGGNILQSGLEFADRRNNREK